MRRKGTLLGAEFLAAAVLAAVLGSWGFHHWEPASGSAMQLAIIVGAGLTAGAVHGVACWLADVVRAVRSGPPPRRGSDGPSLFARGFELTVLLVHSALVSAVSWGAMSIYAAIFAVMIGDLGMRLFATDSLLVRLGAGGLLGFAFGVAGLSLGRWAMSRGVWLAWWSIMWQRSICCPDRYESDKEVAAG